MEESKAIQARQHLTKYGGYKEVPRELITECMEDVGLEEEPIVMIAYGKGEASAGWGNHVQKPVVTILRREDKRSVPYSLKHEFAHIKLGHVFPEWVGVEKSLSTRIEHDLAVHKLLNDDRLSVDDLIDVASTYVIGEKEPKRQVLSAIMEESAKLGASKNIRTRARKWLGGFLKEIEHD